MKEATSVSRRIRWVLALAAVVLSATAVGPVVHAAPMPAPAFALELFNGQTLRLADLKGTAVILLFWANW